jgi:hypothetical protein
MVATGTKDAPSLKLQISEAFKRLPGINYIPFTFFYYCLLLERNRLRNNFWHVTPIRTKGAFPLIDKRRRRPIFPLLNQQTSYGTIDINQIM